MTTLRGKYIEIAHFGDERIEAQRHYFQHNCKTESENVSYVSVVMDNKPDSNNLKGMGFVYSSRGFIFIIGEE